MTIIDSLSSHIGVIDEHGTILAVNTAWKIFAASNPPIHGNVSEGANYLLVCDKAIGEDSFEAHEFARGIRSVLSGDTPLFEMEYSCHSPTERRWFIGRVTPLPGKASYQAVIVHEDITSRHEAEEKLKANQDWLRLYFELPFIGMTITSPETKHWLRVNSRLCEIFGYPEKELLEKTWPEITHPDDLSADIAEFDRVIRGESDGYIMDKRFIRKDGAIVYATIDVKCIRRKDGTVDYFVATIQDITGRKKTEKDLQDSESRYRELFDKNPNPTWVYDLETLHFLAVNEAATNHYGYTEEEFLSISIMDIRRAEDIPDLLKHLQLMRDGKSDSGLRHHRKRNGDIIDVQVTSHPLSFRGRDAAMVIAWDVTDLRQSEAERIRLTTAIEQAAEAVVITDVNGNLQFVNHAFEQITGYSRNEVLGRSSSILKSGRHNEHFYHSLWETILQGHDWHGRLFNRKKDGTIYQEEAVISPVFDDEGEIINFVAVKRDISKEVALEDKLRQSQKMESIGQLAGGIAHDFNNLLQAIYGYIQFAQRGLPTNEQRFLDLEEARKSAERAADLTRQLLAFSRRQVLQTKTLDLNDLVTDLLKLLRRLIGEDIDLRFEASGQAIAVNADPSQIQQVLINLAVNARDAMPEGGEITIETSEVVLGSEYCETHPMIPPGHYALLLVSDTGCGMDHDTLDRLFEPFFTTKELGHGTGLGLATVYGIVKQHEGFIMVYSEVDKGTAFKVYLPIVPGEIIPMEFTEKIPVLGGSETILVAEDDPSVRVLFERILSDAGYKVLLARDGEEAVSIFEMYVQEVSLVILDIVMPHLGGREARNRIQAIQPKTPILFSSGYSADAIRTRFVSDEGIDLITKPFIPELLLGKVREILNRNLE